VSHGHHDHADRRGGNRRVDRDPHALPHLHRKRLAHRAHQADRGALNTLSWASVSHPHEVIRAVRALPALRADPIGPLHGHKVAVVRHAHDAAVDGVRR